MLKFEYYCINNLDTYIKPYNKTFLIILYIIKLFKLINLQIIYSCLAIKKPKKRM